MKKIASKIRNTIEKYYIEFTIVIVVLFNLIKIIPGYLSLSDFWRSYILNYYVLSYQSAGRFISRGLVGTITDLFTDSINSKIFYVVFWLLYFIIYTIIAIKIVRIAKNKSYNLIYLFLGTMILFSPAIMNYASDFARPDIFLILLAYFSMFLIYKNRGLFLVPFLCVAGVLVHEGYICFFMPIIGIFFLNCIAEKKDIKRIVFFLISIVVCLLAVIVVFKYGKTNFDNIDVLFQTIQNKIDIPLNSNMINFEFGDMKADLGSISWGELSTYTTWLELIFYACIFLPIYFIYFKIMLNEIYRIKFGLIKLLYIIAPFSGLVMIFVGVDYGRWFSLSITACCIHLWFFVKWYNIDIIKSLKIQNDKKVIAILGLISMGYLVVGPMGDIHEHFDFLVALNNFVTFFIY